MDEDAFSYKSIHPEIEVSMSTHSIESVKAAYEHDLDYVFWTHFKTPSKPNQLPRSKAEIQCVLEIPIPIYAIGGITEKRFLNYLMVLKEFVRFLFYERIFTTN